MIKRELEDIRIADKCHNCCLCCETFKTGKEQKNCEVRKARGRITNRAIRKAKKESE